ncbi:MAG: DUF2927 domain-containing protein [Magnetococcales bacterium]|nr:DUF2927 domain-containing protein [Magnetococcales bacterium]
MIVALTWTELGQELARAVVRWLTAVVRWVISTARWIVIGLLLLPGTVDAGEQLERLVDLFDRVVFGSEIDPALRSTVVAKWQGPLRVSIQGRATPDLARQASRHLNTLRRLTGLTIQQERQDPLQANFYLLFVRAREMAGLPIQGVDPALIQRLGAAEGCYFLTARQPAQRIVKAYIVVNVERDPVAIDACLLEEMAQALGLPNDTDVLRPSIFSDQDRLIDPSPTDALIIQTLYDPTLPAGLERAAALPRVREIIAGRLAAAARYRLVVGKDRPHAGDGQQGAGKAGASWDHPGVDPKAAEPAVQLYPVRRDPE